MLLKNTAFLFVLFLEYSIASIGTLYIIDCNVCRCKSSGFIDVTACTNRYCAPGHKADTCNMGDILRIDNEICACSDINFYIDRLCLSIKSRPVQEVTEHEIAKLVEVGKSWRRVDDLLFSTCDTEVIYSVDCNKCLYTEEHLACTTKTCTLKKNMALRHEIDDKEKNEFESLPQLHSIEEKCTPGLSYRYECNICHCTKSGVPSCGNMVCLENYVLDQDALRANASDFQDLPEIRYGEPCEDGKQYKMDCNTCLCRNKSLLCTLKGCIDKSVFKDTLRQKRKKDKKAYSRSRDATAKKLIVSDREFLMLPQLPHHAADCTPAHKYKVDCNVCLCTKEKNLVCDNKMCVDHKTTRNIEAAKHTGKPCSRSFDTQKCVRCLCKNGKTNCTPIANCQTEEDKLMLSSGGHNVHRLTFDYKVEECFPDIVYKEKCNKCYCQPDKTLRCTNKMCLNHAQALQLEQQRQYLEQNGL